jgi:hypothetical protein
MNRVGVPAQCANTGLVCCREPTLSHERTQPF